MIQTYTAVAGSVSVQHRPHRCFYSATVSKGHTAIYEGNMGKPGGINIKRLWGSTRRKRRAMSRTAALSGSQGTGRRCWPQWCGHWAPTAFFQVRRRRRRCTQGPPPDCHRPEIHSRPRIFYNGIHRWAYVTSLFKSKNQHFC